MGLGHEFKVPCAGRVDGPAEPSPPLSCVSVQSGPRARITRTSGEGGTCTWICFPCEPKLALLSWLLARFATCKTWPYLSKMIKYTVMETMFEKLRRGETFRRSASRRLRFSLFARNVYRSLVGTLSLRKLEFTCPAVSCFRRFWNMLIEPFHEATAGVAAC